MPTDEMDQIDQTTSALPRLAAIELGKAYGESFKLGPVGFALAPGATVAFLGKNGAGKSTLFQLLTGNLDATGGEVLLDGQRLTPDTPELKRCIGYLPQHATLPRWVTGHEILAYAASLYGLADPAPKVEAAEAYWDCASYRHKPLMTLSYGMQKRVALALATMHDPACLILDEPHSGLDLFHIKALDNEIARRARAGHTTIMSTHVAAFAARLCDEVYLVERGEVRSLIDFAKHDFLGRIDAIETAFFA